MDTIIRGDTWFQYLCFVDAQGEPFDLTGCTVWFTAKAVLDPDADDDLTDALAILSHFIVISFAGVVTSSAGMVLGGMDLNQDPPVAVSTAAAGVITHRIVPAETTALDVQSMIFDIQVEDAGGDVWTPINGLTLSVTADVTRRMTTP